MSKYLLS